ncbi:putative nicotinamide N-methyltransferase [Aspergillus undulatus]|uniref:putative nicotinamide N-methyltransferase n=1 Tax=Aspergillus undulatus TaxID=1810928 RepID=UPI003CCE4DB7
MGLHARLRPLPRRVTVPAPSTAQSTAPPPVFTSDNYPPDEDEEDAEDVFTSFLPHLFPDDAPQFHGDPGQHLLYSSPRYGELDIMVPSYPSQSASGERSKEVAEGLPRSDGQKNEVEEGRKLFAHFLWSAAMVVAEGLEMADSGIGGDEAHIWKVQGEKVLELGAGAGLPSIIAALAGASTVTVTDHPSSPALGPSGAITFNVKYNIPQTNATCAIDIRPHEWGTTLTSDPWALSSKGEYTRIIAADCYWMSSQHENLARTMKWFLAPTGKVWVVAGFHTGRPIVAGFFETAVKMGLEIESIYERDLNSSVEDGGEVRREWVSEKDGEGPENRRRWCVIAVLRHASDTSSTSA